MDVGLHLKQLGNAYCETFPLVGLGRSAGSAAALTIWTALAGACDYAIDVDLNHDGRFHGAGELGYVHGRLAEGNVVRLGGLVEGRYGVRARLLLPGGREVISAAATCAVAPCVSRFLPMGFEANQGQAAADVLFVGRGRGQMIFLKAAETVVVAASTRTVDSKGAVKTLAQAQRFRLVSANPEAVPEGRNPLPGKHSYFLGNDPGRWHVDIPTFERLIATEVYPGVDMVYHSAEGSLEYDFHLAPGADPAVITFEFPDATDVAVDRNGDLVVRQGDEVVRKAAPVAYQHQSGDVVAVKSAWVLKDRGRAGYVVYDYDSTRELVIDPILFSTYLGGSLDETAQAATVDASGNTYVAGFTLSANFPLTTPFQAALGGPQDMFVTKINATGTAVMYSTYLGGSGNDGWINGKQGIAVDAAGNACVTAGVDSVNYPLLNPAQAVYGGNPFDCVVTKLNPAGNGLVFSTYLGGNSWDLGYGLTVDAGGAIYVVGLTSSPNFPTTAGVMQTTLGGGNDAFVAKYTPAGALVYATYLGGTGGNEWGRAVAVQGGNAYVIGVTDSPNFPTTPGAFRTTNAGGWDIFVTQLNAGATAAVYSTYLGGSLTEDCWGIALDAAGNAFIAARTDSANFPITPGAAQTAFGGGTTDGAVVKLNPTGSGLVYSTFLGGSAVDETRAIAIDATGATYITGFTLSANFPTVNPLQPAYGGGGGDAFVTVLNPAGSAWVFSTWVGGSGPDGGVGIGLDGATNIYIGGSTNSANFPTLNPVQAANGGMSDMFITKLSLPSGPGPGPGPGPGSTQAFGPEGSYQGSTSGKPGPEGGYGLGARERSSPVLVGPMLDSQNLQSLLVFHVPARQKFSPSITLGTEAKASFSTTLAVGDP